MQVWLNGEFLPEKGAALNLAEEGLKYGYGLFETVRVQAGQPLLLPEHEARLAAAAADLDFTPQPMMAQLATAIPALISANNILDGVLRISRTVAGSLWVTAASGAPYPESMAREGVRAAFSMIRRNETSPLCRWKTFNYLDNILAKREAAARGFGEALFLNSQGQLAEGSVSNIFLIKKGVLITPDQASGLLPGIIRARVLRLAVGLPTEERKVAADELWQAEECFLTNSLMGVMPLVAVEGRPIGAGLPGPLTLRLRQLLREHGA